MATVLDLERQGLLIRVDARLGPKELEERTIFLLPETAVKLAEIAESMESKWEIETSPAEQLDDLFYHFCTGGILDFPRQFHELSHVRDGIWQLKTPDIRLFGWFVSKDCFICSDVADANEVKRLGLYAGYCEQTWFKREKLDLDNPKFILGGEPSDVISNFYSSK